MASEPLQVYSGKRILLEYYNRVNQKNLHLNDVQFGQPVPVNVVGTNFNTTIRMYPNLGTPFYGSPRLNYDRIHVSQLGVIVVAKGTAVRVHDLLTAINAKYNINLSAEDVENDVLPATSGNVTVNLRIKPESVLFYEGPIIYTPNYPDPALLPLPQIDQYAFWSAYRSSANVVIADNDRSALMNYEHMAMTQLPITEGKIYWEIKIDAGSLRIGIGRPDTPRSATGVAVLGQDETNWVLNTASGKLEHNGAEYNYIAPIAAGSTIGVMYDYGSGILTFVLGNQILPAAFVNLPAMAEVYPIISGALTSNSKGTGNYGQVPMFYTVPSGYKTGLYTLVPIGGSNPPPPGSGGGGVSHPPAGTLLGSFCQDGDFWLVTATGAGGFTIVLTESESVNCGFDENEYPIIDGGSSSGNSPGPTLTVVGGPFSANEGSFVDIPFMITQPLTTDLTLRFNRAFQSASQADISSFEYKTALETSYTTLTDGSDISVGAGQTTFNIRAYFVADATTEGNEIFTVILKEPVLRTLLDNSTPLIVPVVINDTSLTPGGPTPTALITVDAADVFIDEGSQGIVGYQLTEPVSTNVQILFKRILGTAANVDVVSYEYAVNTPTNWAMITNNTSFVVPANATSFFIRLTTFADENTEGDETITISCEENVINGVRKLAQITPVTKLVTIVDTSTTPTNFPTNPPTPAGFTGGESYSFNTDPGDQFELDENNGSTTVVWLP